MEVIGLLWLAFSVVVGVLASRLSRNGLAWFILAVLVSPLIAGLLVIVLGNAPDEVAKEECPFCKELVIAGAVKCKHCGSTLIKAEPQDKPEQSAHRPPSKAAHKLGKSIGLAMRKLLGN